MSNDVVLSAALRNNLLSLQNTQKAIDTHQTRLATGKKVNSALDNPQAFFAAQTLTNRANDLSNLLDSIGQSIQVIQAANNGVSALTTLINQAQSLANTAQSTLAGSSTTAKTSGTVNLGDGSAKYTSLNGVNTGDRLVITVTDTSGGFTAGASINAQTITTVANDTINDIITRVNDLNTTLGLTSPAIKASLDSSGHLTFEAVNGGTLNVRFQANTFSSANDLAEATALGFGTISKSQQNGAASTNTTQDVTVLAKNAATSKALYTNNAGTIALAQLTSRIQDLRDSTGATGTVVNTTTNAADTLTITVNGKTSSNLLGYTPPGGIALTAQTSTIGSVIDAINHDTNISSLVSASYDATTGKISLTSLGASATDVQLKFGVATSGDKLALGFGTSTFTSASATDVRSEDIFFGAAAGSLASLQTQYNTTLSQIDALVKDTGYAGTNLLNGNNLTTYFDESLQTSLTTSGTTFTSGALGLSSANFQNAASIGVSVTQLQTALTSVRNFGSTLSTNLTIIQARQTFTNSLISTLETGSDALTNADQNEEGASLLALQTRQSLGITSLSLASQAQQAILRLF